MINTRVGSSIKDVSGVYTRVGSSIKEVSAVWTNVGGHLYQIWPVAHTAYDGSTFKGALSGGLVSGFSMYCITDYGHTATNKTIYHDYPITANASCTSGVATINASEYDKGDTGSYFTLGWRSANLVNLSLYDSISLASSISTYRYLQYARFEAICLINANGTEAIYIMSDDYLELSGTCDVSSISGSYYILFIYEIHFGGSSTSQNKYCTVNINSISFA